MFKVLLIVYVVIAVPSLLLAAFYAKNPILAWLLGFITAIAMDFIYNNYMLNKTIKDLKRMAE